MIQCQYLGVGGGEGSGVDWGCFDGKGLGFDRCVKTSGQRGAGSRVGGERRRGDWCLV